MNLLSPEPLAPSLPPDTAWEPLGFYVMAKPRGPICNLDCKYCYYLAKEMLYPGSRFKMASDLLDRYIEQYIDAQRVPEVTFAWQGGEPTLAGLDFYREVVQLQEKHRRPGVRILNTLQTNGTTLTDEWCEFFARHDFLIGISIDGPQALHDSYRVDKGGKPTFEAVMAGVELLKKHRVEYNVLTTLNSANVMHPLEVYRFLRDEVGARFMQFIPIVEQEGEGVSEHSVSAEDYGDFLCAVFDEWVKRDVGTVFVQMFDVALASWAGEKPGLCIFEETCGTALAMEHNGDVYSCDHFVQSAYKLGNIQDKPLGEIARSRPQHAFALAKRDTLPEYCRGCEVRFACNGGCPKDRFILTPDGERGLNYLCAGYKRFFTHIGHAMDIMVSELRMRRPPARVMAILRQEDAHLRSNLRGVGRNDPCPCGSGRKYKRCHGGH
jgi:uncharacterized protein